MCANLQAERPTPREGYIPAESADLYYREIGQGEPVIVLHGGPDFGHSYLLPDMDVLADSFRLIYYDQRGRGRSAGNVRPEDVRMKSEMEDIERVREHFRLDSVAVLGHSFGGLLAMEYAIRYPERVSRLILMNSAPASRDDYLLFREERRKASPADVEGLKEISATAGYLDGDPDTVAAYYRIHFRATVRQPEQLERVVGALRSSFTQEGIMKAWAIEDQLMNETWLASEYDLLPKLRGLTTPTLVIHGDYDFIPVECAAHIAQAIPGAQFTLLEDCGHFSYMECPDEVRREVIDFFVDT